MDLGTWTDQDGTDSVGVGVDGHPSVLRVYCQGRDRARKNLLMPSPSFAELVVPEPTRGVVSSGTTFQGLYCPNA